MAEPVSVVKGQVWQRPWLEDCYFAAMRWKQRVRLISSGEVGDSLPGKTVEAYSDQKIEICWKNASDGVNHESQEHAEKWYLKVR